ncbi:IclR family transcriptional regulator [Nocardioides lijunqiniae]|uniref:IclR family transcriptional regulator n=1 Tax=Nocardioides lijunqiniae TaxID=2760832 RepID=UPI0018780B69|nr:IclR family transcriptional regulator [Nocardioides lijunqiniae]
MTKGSASAVDKALDLLEAIAQARSPMTLSELAEEVGMLRPTAHRVLAELTHRGWVFRHDGRYLPGPSALHVSHEAAANSLAALCLPTMRELSESTDMMVNLQVLERDGTRIIAALRPERLKMITRMVGDLLPPHRFAGPLALVAALEDTARAPYLAMVEQSGYPLEGPQGFLADVEETRTTGFAVVHRRSQDIIGSVSRAVLSRKGSPLCALTVIGFDSDFDDATTRTVEDHLLRATDEVQALLTHHTSGKRPTDSGEDA